MSQGVLYVGPKQPYFDQAIESAESLQSSNNIPASIVTSPKLSETEDTHIFDRVITIEHRFDDVRDPPYNFDKTPYEKTVFLDGDTQVIGDISGIFELLERVDIAAVMSPHRNTIEMPDIPECFPKFNTGVIAYTSSENVWEMIEQWTNIIEEQIQYGRPRPDETMTYGDYQSLEELSAHGNSYDETAFREAVYKSDVTWSMLPPEYNFGKTGRGDTQEEVKILHGKHRNTLRDIINERDVPRVIVGNKLYFQYRHHTESVRLEGIPVVEPIVHYLRLPSVSKKLGVYDPLQRLYQSIREKFE